MADSTANPELSESVEELKFRLETMRRLMEDTEEEGRGRRRRKGCSNSLVNATFLSFSFIIVLLLIICVAIHSFQNLFYAVIKKFHAGQHTEL